MSFAFASYNEYGIVISADRCITGTSTDGQKYTATSLGQKLFLTSQGYGITFTGCSSVGNIPVPVKIKHILKELDGDIELTNLFAQFISQMAGFSQENIIFIAAGYSNGKASILSATTRDTTIKHFSNIGYSGESELGKLLICALPIDYDMMDVFSCRTLINISCLHLGQYSGNFSSTVSAYTFIRVFPPQAGQHIQ